MGNYKIPSWFWLICGIIISIYSQIVITNTGTNLSIFFYIGIVFIVIGIFKILVEMIMRQSKNPKEKVQPKNKKENKYIIIHCHKCKAKNYKTFNYCQNCGSKLIK